MENTPLRPIRFWFCYGALCLLLASLLLPMGDTFWATIVGLSFGSVTIFALIAHFVLRRLSVAIILPLLAAILSFAIAFSF